MLNKSLHFVFLILIFSLAFMQPYLKFSKFSLPITDFVFILAAILFGMAIILGKRKIRSGGFYLPLIIYFIPLALSAAFSINLSGSMVKLLGVIFLIGLAFLAYNLSANEKEIRNIALAWLAGTAIACIISALTLVLFYIDRENSFIGFAISHYGSLPEGNYPRIRSTFQNPNMLCNYLNAGFLFLLLAGHKGWIREGLFLIFAIIFAIASIFTFSAGIGGIILSAGIWYWLLFEKKGKHLLSKVSLSLALISAVGFFLILLPSPANLSEPSARVLTWNSALETFTKYPLFGKGLGENAADVKYQRPDGAIQPLTDAHNIWLNIAAQAGTFGFTGLIFLCIYFGRKLLPLGFDNQNSYLRIAFGLAFLGAFLYQGLSGSYEDARHIWVLMGLFGSSFAGDFPIEAEKL